MHPVGSGQSVFSEQCAGLACQFFKQQFVAAGGCGSDDFLVDAVAVAAGGWDVTGLPVPCQRGDKDGSWGESLSQLDLQVLIQFTGDKEPEAVTGDSDGDFEWADGSGSECFEASDLSSHLFDIGAAIANGVGISA